MRAITEAESFEIIDTALSGPMDIPRRHNDPLFPGQPIPWKEILDKTPVTKKDLYKSVMLATKALNPGHYTGFLAKKDFYSHINENDSDTVSKFSGFLQDNMAIEET